MKKQTTVEWLYEELKTCIHRDEVADLILDLQEQAKAMEKEQIIDAFINEDYIQWDKQLRTRAAEQYYNETYKELEQ